MIASDRGKAGLLGNAGRDIPFGSVLMWRDDLDSEPSGGYSRSEKQLRSPVVPMADVSGWKDLDSDPDPAVVNDVRESGMSMARILSVWSYSVVASAFGGYMIVSGISVYGGLAAFAAGMLFVTPAQLKRFARLAREAWYARSHPVPNR
jgi:hypothetical protein